MESGAGNRQKKVRPRAKKLPGLRDEVQQTRDPQGHLLANGTCSAIERVQVRPCRQQKILRLALLVRKRNERPAHRQEYQGKDMHYHDRAHRARFNILLIIIIKQFNEDAKYHMEVAEKLF